MPKKHHSATRTTLRWLAAVAGSPLLCSNVVYAADPLPVNPSGQIYAAPAKNIAVVGNQRFSYDSNPLKLTRGFESLMGSETEGRLILSDTTPDSVIRSNSMVSQGLYDNSDFDTTNFQEIITLGHRTNQWNLSLDSTLDYDTTRTAELTSFGITAPNVRHTQYGFAPEVSFRPTADNELKLRGNWRQSTYDNNSFVDYTAYDITPSVRHRLDEIHSALLSFNYHYYTTDSGTKVTTRSYGPSLGVQTEWSTRLRSRFLLGGERSEREVAQAGQRTQEQTNYVYAGTLTYHTDQHKMDFSASRAQRPTANGQSGLYSTLRLSENYLINQQLSVRGEAIYRDARYIGNAGVNLDSEYTGQASLSYRVWQNLDITSTYQYTDQTLTNNAGDVRAHMVLIGLSLHPFEWEL